ncbi:MAG: hypothetical protein KAS32_15730 [Candidatus Peribacteraceae bacterium]|nr:hypothetical protein [Candidatus Peribacteraceae bacterium]
MTEEKLTINKLYMMTTSELKELKKRYNPEDDEFIRYVIDDIIAGRFDD